MTRSGPQLQRSRAGTALAAACLALLLFAPAHAARTARRTVKHRPATASLLKPIAPPAVASPAAPVGTAGMVVAIDPETGALVPPTLEQLRALTAAERTGLMRTSEGLTEVRLPNGAVKLDLQGRFMEFGLAQLDPAGCPQFFSVNDETVLRMLLARRAPAPTPVIEEK
jgi:hypothetical protein